MNSSQKKLAHDATKKSTALQVRASNSIVILPASNATKTNLKKAG